MSQNLPIKPEFTLEIDGQNSASWAAVLAQFADANIYQTWAYGAVRWGDHKLSHAVLRRNGRIVAAAQLRIAKPPVLPLGIAYLRWGPLYQLDHDPIDTQVVHEMLAGLQREYVAQRGLALQLIPHAFPGTERGTALENALARTSFQPEPQLGSYRTVLVDLHPESEVLRKCLDKKWRNQLNASERNGLTFEAGNSPEAYREFLRLYGVMWERKRFETSVSVEEFEQIQHQLAGNSRMQIFLARHEGVSVAALVCSALGDTTIYVLGATDEKARDLKAAYFLHWQTMLWLKARGLRWYDLGGIDPVANPGGYHFKSGFGGAEATQLPPRVLHAGMLSRKLTGLVGWLRHKRAASKMPASDHDSK